MKTTTYIINLYLRLNIHLLNRVSVSISLLCVGVGVLALEVGDVKQIPIHDYK